MRKTILSGSLWICAVAALAAWSSAATATSVVDDISCTVDVIDGKGGFWQLLADPNIRYVIILNDEARAAGVKPETWRAYKIAGLRTVSERDEAFGDAYHYLREKGCETATIRLLDDKLMDDPDDPERTQTFPLK